MVQRRDRVVIDLARHQRRTYHSIADFYGKHTTSHSLSMNTANEAIKRMSLQSQSDPQHCLRQDRVWRPPTNTVRIRLSGSRRSNSGRIGISPAENPRSCSPKSLVVLLAPPADQLAGSALAETREIISRRLSVRAMSRAIVHHRATQLVKVVRGEQRAR